MCRKLLFLGIIILLFLVGCVTINNTNVNNPPPKNEDKTDQATQAQPSEKENEQNQNSEEEQQNTEQDQQNETTTPEDGEEENNEESEVDKRAQEAQKIVDKVLNTYQTTSTDILMREGSSIKYNSLQQLSSGTEIYVKDYFYDNPIYEVWLKVEYRPAYDPDTLTEGWIPYKAIHFNYYPESDGLSDEEKSQRAADIADKVYKTYQTISTDILMRENSNIEYKSVKMLPAGTEVYVDGYSYGTPTYEVWLRVTYQPEDDESDPIEGYIPYGAIDLDYYP